MTDRANGWRSESDSAENRESDGEIPDGTETIEAYEIEDGIVFYDARNPLAWVQSSTAVTLEDTA